MSQNRQGDQVTKYLVKVFGTGRFDPCGPILISSGPNLNCDVNHAASFLIERLALILHCRA